MPQETLEAPPSDEEVALAKAQTINSFVFNFASTGSQLQRRLVYDLVGLPEVCNKAHSARYWSSRFRNTLQSLVLRWTELNITVDYSISSECDFVQYSFFIMNLSNLCEQRNVDISDNASFDGVEYAETCG